MSYRGDVFLFQTVNGGDVELINGVLTLTGGLDNAVYLSLFGGNIDDNGKPGNKLSWWGNVDEEINNQYRSKTQYVLRNLPATTGNIATLRDAVESDLKWMINESIATTITIAISITGLNMVTIKIDIFKTGDDLISGHSFTLEWYKEIKQKV